MDVPFLKLSQRERLLVTGVEGMLGAGMAGGGHVILIVKTDSGPLDVFVPASSDALESANDTKPGDEVEVIGTVKTYKSQKEVVADSIKQK